MEINAVSYEKMFTRNIGFVTESEQQIIRNTPVFICGVGGMGGSCLMNLVRAGFENLGVADIDTFEISNLNRQLFANMNTIGIDKADSAVKQISQLNPSAKVQNYGHDWLTKLDEIFTKYKIVVNGTDDLKAGLFLYRKAKEHGATVIDAFTSPLPSVYVVSPEAPRPEEYFGYPTCGIEIKNVTPDMENECKMREATYVMACSSSRKHIDMDVAMQVVEGKRSRMSFAPMVIMTGCLMAYQVVAVALKRSYVTDHKGYFVQAWSGKLERASWEPLHQLKIFFVRMILNRMMK